MNLSPLKIALALVAIIISSYIAVGSPFALQSIPFTTQSLVVFVCAAFLAPIEIAITILIYLLLGVAGAPVFAEGTSGWSKLSGSSGGFLWGFLVSGALISCYYSSQVSFMRLLGLMFLATIVLFMCGLGQLTVKFGFEKAIEYGFTPFWKMALLKAFIATGVVFFNNSILNRQKKDIS